MCELMIVAIPNPFLSLITRNQQAGLQNGGEHNKLMRNRELIVADTYKMRSNPYIRWISMKM